MFQHLRRELRTLRRERPGERFQRWHARRHRAGWSAAKLVRWLLAVALIAVGMAMMVAPGPGLLVTAAGAGLLAQDALWIARGMDRAELLLRRLWRRWRGAAAAP